MIFIDKWPKKCQNVIPYLLYWRLYFINAAYQNINRHNNNNCEIR